jgi:hypothetical protein
MAAASHSRTSETAARIPGTVIASGLSSSDELFKEQPIYEQSAVRTVREQQEKRSCR